MERILISLHALASCVNNTFLILFYSAGLIVIERAQEDLLMASLAKLCDANEDLLKSGVIHVVPPIFQSYGLKQTFSGPTVTLRVLDEDVSVRELIEGYPDGDGKVLLVDGGGRCECSLMGENLVMLARNKGWSGIVVHGCVREVYEINKCDIGVRALGSNPVKGRRRSTTAYGTVRCPSATLTSKMGIGCMRIVMELSSLKQSCVLEMPWL
ncbi:Regulator of ribonuclease-like protein 2 [Platanthera guangdongensis]|uniref:4-hydroxy-4-methyl-2-oxoglutarate aldolase n=1 Tax=Platanthera guangdongensis TaxID=2320717 RepID=A0ABR2LGG1_9ASPA